MVVDISYYDREFPLLVQVGLYAARTSGKGNCLFHSLSDQMYGHESNHLMLRKRVVLYIRLHAEYFKPFVPVQPPRRTPRRRVAAASAAELEAHTQAEIDRAFECRLAQMQKSGVFGDNLEIQAFAREFQVNVKVYRQDCAYIITPEYGVFETSRGKEDLPTVHIAYHNFEHYSSIRSRDGPHDGLPSLPKRSLSPDTVEEDDEGGEEAHDSESGDRIRKFLETHKGNMNDTANQLINEYGSQTSKELDVTKHESEGSNTTQPQGKDGDPSGHGSESGSTPSITVSEELEDIDKPDYRTKRRKSRDGSSASTTSGDSASTEGGSCSTTSSESERSRKRKLPTPAKSQKQGGRRARKAGCSQGEGVRRTMSVRLTALYV